MKFLYTSLNEYLTETHTLIRGVGKNDTGNVDLFGRGLYLTDDIDVAKFYGETIQEYTVNGRIFDTTTTFKSTELRKFLKSLDTVLNTNFGSKYLQNIVEYNDGRLPKDTGIDYLEISYSLNSNYDFQEILKKNNLLVNDFNSYANDCTAMNLAIESMGYVGLKYSTSSIEDLDDNGLGGRNAYVIFNLNKANKKA